MIVYLSGGSEIAETGLDNPSIMLSYFVCAHNKKRPNARLKRAMKNRWNKTERRKTCDAHGPGKTPSS